MPNDETDLLFVPLPDAFALCSIPSDFGIFRLAVTEVSSIVSQVY